MTANTWRRGFYLLLVLALLMVGVTAKVTYDHAWLSIQTSFANDQTETFDEMRDKAYQSHPENAVKYLEYAVSYYPSGTKQVQGSSLDRIVERARQNAIREILAYLRVKTGKDLGDDPQRWIDELKKTGI
jgi:hypothetical protein